MLFQPYCNSAYKLPLVGLITIAPAVSMWDYSIVNRPKCPWTVIHGKEDEIASLSDVENWLEILSAKDLLVVVPGSSHFFHGKLIQLEGIVTKFLKSIF